MQKKWIRIYSQAVINQMTYHGNNIYEDHYSNSIKIASVGPPFFSCHERIESALNP